PLPTAEVERMVAERDPCGPSPAVFHINRELASFVSVRRQVRRLDLRLDDGRHEGGLALLVEVMWREVDRVRRLDEEEPGLRRGEIDPVCGPLRDGEAGVIA